MSRTSFVFRAIQAGPVALEGSAPFPRRHEAGESAGSGPGVDQSASVRPRQSMARRSITPATKSGERLARRQTKARTYRRPSKKRAAKAPPASSVVPATANVRSAAPIGRIGLPTGTQNRGAQRAIWIAFPSPGTSSHHALPVPAGGL